MRRRTGVRTGMKTFSRKSVESFGMLTLRRSHSNMNTVERCKEGRESCLIRLEVKPWKYQ